jgi:hypothetical protein
MLAKRLRSLAKHASFENLTAGMNSSAAQIRARPPPAIGAIDLPPKSFWLHKQNIKNGKRFNSKPVGRRCVLSLFFYLLILTKFD